VGEKNWSKIFTIAASRIIKGICLNKPSIKSVRRHRLSGLLLAIIAKNSSKGRFFNPDNKPLRWCLVVKLPAI